MARVTVEDCLKHVSNRYELVQLATRRVRQLHQGAEPIVRGKNRIIVNALREIATGLVRVRFEKNSEQLDDSEALPN